MSEMIPGRREGPQLDELGFDARLMTPGRLLALAGGAPVRFSEPGTPLLWLECAACGKGIEPLTDQFGHAYQVEPQQFLSNVLRHLVNAHGVSLSGGNRG